MAAGRQRLGGLVLFDRGRLRFFVVVVAVSALIGFFYSLAFYPPGPDSRAGPGLGLAIGAALGAAIYAFEVWLVSNPYSPLRRLPFLIGFAIRVLAQFVIAALVIALVEIAHDLTWDSDLLALTPQGISQHLHDVSVSFLISAVAVFYMQMRLFIGPRALLRLIADGYNNPVEEERVFLVLDIPGTTSAAQKIGDIAFHRYLNQLFVLFDRPIVANGGEIHSYVGDAVIAHWPFGEDIERNSRVLEALAQITSICHSQADRIEAMFSIRPGVRAAIHAGRVVAGETGHSKRQITFLGDVMNIVSRIEAKTKELDRPLLITAEALSRMKLPETLKAEPIGEFGMKGSRRKTALVELTPVQLNSQ
jgi:adenylate cyclase